MKTFVKNNWKKIIIIAIIIFIIIKIMMSFQKQTDIVKDTSPIKVEVFSVLQEREGFIDSFCSVETSSDVAIIPESSGKVSSVSVTDGQEVTKGQTLFTLENISQRVALQNAKVALNSAELALSELRNDNSSEEGSLLSQTKNQQDILIENAKNRLFNDNLRAYPEENPGDTDELGPIIEGNYNCSMEGEYIIEVYSSNAESGASFRYSGIEDGTTSVSTTTFGTRLGNCGLEIRFPEDFSKRETWIIPVPNTQSANYFNVKKDYENTVSGKDIIINNTEASPERIQQEQARVTQAKLQLESAYNNLSKTIVTAPVSGTVSSFDINTGDFVNQNNESGRIKSINDLELIAYVNADERPYLTTDNTVVVEEKETSIIAISPSIDSQTKKIKITVAAPVDTNLIEGTQYSCGIERNITQVNITTDNGGVIIPLSAISVIGTETYIFEIVDNYVQKQSVETGALLGDSIVVYGLHSEAIISDARGIREGQKITTE